MKLVAKKPDRAYICENMWLPKTAINVDGMKGALTFTYVDEREVKALCLWQETQDHLIVPREFWDQQQVPPFEVVDCRPTYYPSMQFHSVIKLDSKNPHETIQRDALEAMLRSRGGILQLSCGRGKTIIALELIARLGVPALIVVDNSQLLRQWREEITKFLGVPEKEIGLIGDGVFDWQKKIVLATYQTLAQKAATFPQEVRRWFGVTIWDEAHHVAAPTFSRSVDLFYGRRYGLTATPNRPDGMNVLYELHIGPVVYKNLTQNLKPEIYFVWTGMQVDTKDAQVRPMVCDKNGELHLGKLAGYFGQWDTRLNFISTEVRKAANAGRKILVLSNSVDELINLYAMWIGYQKYTDVPVPTPTEVGSPVMAVEMDEKKLKRTWARLHATDAELKSGKLSPVQMNAKQSLRDVLARDIDCHHAWEMVQKLLRKRQREYIVGLLEQPSNAGLLTFKVSVDERQRMLKTKDVIFSIMKYGREGLDKPDLDTVFLCEPMSQKNVLQQVMGRALRELVGKSQPVFIVLEDDIGPMIGMCQVLRKHLREWPVEEGGPYQYNLVGYPNRRHSQRSMSL
jgi:superfamily II DNA or RNA helicase